ncbi:LysR family transcriptional regulator [Azospirillum sp. YIM B02556]|uniref:LysR family transcriptional regulator n=1 Tax=Azospirillum endophyticum TaxID=2800326 RepID=A0ABS1F6D0_9PROT|nr:LysR family transcriptional regulator [Azospirillum endophyticum]MBK1838995.1 LysR family transcriptional regulator [Azospirillum endophyticum]
MITSNDLHFFAVLSGARSLAAAARALDVTPPAVTQRLQQLEQRLGVRLVERSSRQLHLTVEGELLAGRGAELLAELDGLADALVARRKKVTGHLRVAAPFGFGRRYVAPAMAALRTRHPDVTLSLMLFEDPAFPRADGWDVLIHVGALGDSALTLHRLAANRRILCASPAYLARCGMPERPEDLRRHDCGVIRENKTDESLWRFAGSDGEQVTLRLQPALASNDGTVIRDWGLAGLGIIVRSEWDVADDLKLGRLIALLPGWQLPDADIVALTGSRSGRVARVATFLEELRSTLHPIPWRVDRPEHVIGE